MNDFLTKFLIALGGIVLIGLIAVLGGTFVWLLWPVAIPVAFPGLVASGVLASKLSWWVSVCLTWLFSILLKSSNNNIKND